MPRALITTVPFASVDPRPLHLLEQAGIDYVINPLGRKLKEGELAELIVDYDLLIAGTEPITERVLGQAKRLRLISRVGIGLDSVDLVTARKREIQVSYTPDAPAPAVAELTLGLMLSLLRHIHVSNERMHRGEWQRWFGRRLPEITVGVIGVGRIGGRVLQALSGFGVTSVLANDLTPHDRTPDGMDVRWVGKDEIYQSADLITLHVPLTPDTRNLICRPQLDSMRSDAILLNTSRGGIVNEEDLASVLLEERLAGAAVDVFVEEPYSGPLCQIERCLLTSHMGSMSVDCRTRMEIEATEEVVRFVSGQPLRGAVPEEEFEMQRRVL